MKHTFSSARLLSLVMVLAVLLTAGIVLGINASAEETTTTYVSDWSGFTAAVKNGGEVVLTCDISTPDASTAKSLCQLSTTAPALTIRSGEGGPYTIKISDALATSGFTGRLFVVNGGFQPITFLDVIFDGNFVQSASNGSFFYMNGAEGILNLGSPDEPGKYPEFRNFVCPVANGSTIYAGKNIVNVYGAKFYGNEVQGTYGDGVCVNGGALNVYGTVYMEKGGLYSRGSAPVTLYEGANFVPYETDVASLTDVLSATTINWSFFCNVSATGEENLTIGNILLGKDISISGEDATTISVAGAKTIDGNGYAVSCELEDTPAFTVPAGAELTLADIAIRGDQAIYVNGEATLNIVGDLCVGANSIAAENDTAVITLADTARLFVGVIADADTFIAQFGEEAITPTWGTVSSATVVDNGATFAIGLLNDITLTTTETISVAGTKLIGGNGYTVYRSANASGKAMFTLAEGADLTFANIILDGKFVTEDATANGGAFNVVEGATLTLEGRTVVKNFKANIGGALYTEGNVTMRGNAQIVNNTSSGQGGGVYADLPSSSNIFLLEDNAQISNNQAPAFAGGIRFGRGQLTLSDNAKLAGNQLTSTTANKQGGGIYLTGGTILIQDNASLEGNFTPATAKYFYGGGIYVQTGTVVMTGGTIAGNGSGGSNYSRGGAIYMAKGDIWILDGEISGNKTTQYGGAIFAGDAASVYVIGGDIKDNEITYKAGNASVVYTSGKVYFLGGNIIGNTATGTSKYAIMANAPTAYIGLGSSVEPTSIPSEVTAFAATDAGKKCLNIVDGVITSKTPLVIEANGTDAGIATTYHTTICTDQSDSTVTYGGKLYFVELMNPLVLGSRVVFSDTTEAVLRVAADNISYAGICLLGADSIYEAFEAKTDTVGTSATTIGKCTDNKDKTAYTVNESETTLIYFTNKEYSIARSAALNDTVDFRLYVAYRDMNAERQTVTAKMTDMFGDKTYDQTEAKVGYASYVVIPMAPKYMTTEVTLYLGEQELGKYKLADYLKDVETKYANDVELVALVKSLMNYGSAAQVYLEYNKTSLANDAYKTALENVTVGTTDENAFSIVGNNEEAFHSADVEIASKVSVTVIMKAAAYNDGFTVKFGGNKIENVPYRDVNSDYIAITIKDISAADLAKSIVVTLSDGTTLTYSIPAYAERMLGKADDGDKINEDLRVLVKALYAYAVAADAYAN